MTFRPSTAPESAPLPPPIIWVNGRLIEPGEPAVSAIDHGLTVGNGVFETTSLDGGVPFALTLHLARLARSAHCVGLTLPSERIIRAGITTVAAQVGTEQRCRLRVTVTGGAGPLSSEAPAGKPTVIVAAAPAPPPAAASRAIRSSFRRNEFSAITGAKTTSYAENVVALAEAQRDGADEAILANTAGRVCEGTATNVFFIRGSTITTPSLSEGPLGGITRHLAIRWGREAGLDVREEPLPWSALDESDGLVLTSSLRAVMPVEALDGVVREIPEAASALQRFYAERAAEDPDPH